MGAIIANGNVGERRVGDARSGGNRQPAGFGIANGVHALGRGYHVKVRLYAGHLDQAQVTFDRHDFSQRGNTAQTHARGKLAPDDAGLAPNRIHLAQANSQTGGAGIVQRAGNRIQRANRRGAVGKAKRARFGQQAQFGQFFAFAANSQRAEGLHARALAPLRAVRDGVNRLRAVNGRGCAGLRDNR